MAERPRTQDNYIGGIPVRHIRLYGQGNEPAEVDSRSGGLVFIDTVHARVHAGQLFSVNHLDLALADDATIAFLIRTGVNSAHSRPLGVAGGDATLEMFEVPTTTDDGSSLATINQNRFSGNVATTLAFLNPTVTADGTELSTILIFGGTGPSLSVGAQANFTDEWILKTNTDYLIRLTNKAGSVQPAHLQFDFYEPS